MRLLNTTTLELEEFFGACLAYVSLHDMNNGKAAGKTGTNLQFAWIDTCCIDKSSSAELTQAINSMYRYNSSWWTRGWTLQELTALSVVKFYNLTWKALRSKYGLVVQSTAITGIHEKVIGYHAEPESFNIAQRISWASKRTTTRFWCHMPLLYGEGERAFVRLQEEIMKHSNDHSLFARAVNYKEYRGLLAETPVSF
ncbi:hypothetical protein BKA65DRAFT_523610 [Rhexocercosporidium sp. MPI-PUGE-AT-0058]|nr:hypothetical protein BKA65DRAFT_523610 [Rhexocercosporidium sp. MPI-PUGE-AT-0058]